MSVTTVGKDDCGCFTGPSGHTYAEHPLCEYFEHHCETCHARGLCTREACGFTRAKEKTP